jgi:hypothetical protein
MKYRYPLVASFVVALAITSLQTPSSAQMPTSLSMATGMSKAQIQKVYDGLDKAITQVGSAISKAANAGKTKITDTTLTRSGTLAVDDRYTCASGGYIGSTMSTTTVLTKATGFLTISATVRQTISNWRCVADWVVNGSLNLNYKISGTSTGETSGASGGVSGAWKSVGPKGTKQSCQLKGSVQEGTVGAKPTETIRITCVPGGVTVITEKL